MENKCDYDFSQEEITLLQDALDKAIEVDRKGDGKLTYENGLLYTISDILWDVRFGRPCLLRCSENEDEKV